MIAPFHVRHSLCWYLASLLFWVRTRKRVLGDLAPLGREPGYIYIYLRTDEGGTTSSGAASYDRYEA